MKLPSMKPEELKKLAVDYKEGRIFTNRHLSRPEEIGMVFMCLPLMGKDDILKLKQADPGLVYEYVNARMPRSVNGYPMFISARFLSQNDTRKFLKIVETLDEAEKEALAKIR